MGTQWLRKVSLIVGTSTTPNDTGTLPALDLSALQFKFSISKGQVSSPCIAEIIVYNAAPATMQQIPGGSSQGPAGAVPIRLQVGYEGGSLGTIFTGQVWQKMVGRENATDTYMRLACRDSDLAYNFSVLNKTLASGWRHTDLYGAMTQPYAAAGMPIDPPPSTLPQTRAPRGRVLFGDAKDFLRRHALGNGYAGWIDGGGYHSAAFKALGTLAIELTPETGLIGVPEVRPDGVHVRALINANFQVNGVLKLPDTLIAPAQFDPAFLSIPKFGGVGSTGLSPTGTYKIIFIQHTGDTRANDWYSDLLCIAADASAPADESVTQMGVGSA